MSHDTDNQGANALLDMYRINTAFFQRLTQLSQQSHQQWLELSRQTCAEAGTRYGAMFKTVIEARDPQSLAALPHALFAAQSQGRTEAIQESVTAALNIQAAALSRLTEAVKEWQQAASAAAGSLGNAAAGNAWTELLRQLAAGPAADAATTKKGRHREH